MRPTGNKPFPGEILTPKDNKLDTKVQVVLYKTSAFILTTLLTDILCIAYFRHCQMSTNAKEFGHHAGTNKSSEVMTLFTVIGWGFRLRPTEENKCSPT